MSGVIVYKTPNATLEGEGIAGVIDMQTIKKQKGFTLIELMIVVAIIGILASMILPSLSKARGKAQSSLSVNNQKQIATATNMQVDDNNQMFHGLLRANNAGTYFDSGTLSGAYWGDYQPALDKNYINNKNTFICPQSLKSEV